MSRSSLFSRADLIGPRACRSRLLCWLAHQERKAEHAMTHAYGGEPPPRVLVVDDQPAICFTLQRILEHYGYAVAVAMNQVEAQMLVIRDTFDLLLVEPRLLGERGGRLLLQFAQARRPSVALALLTGPNEAVLPNDTAAPDRLLCVDKTASPPAIATGVALALARRGWDSERAAGAPPQFAG
jgi:CheY-like chemotaxis protein